MSGTHNLKHTTSKQKRYTQRTQEAKKESMYSTYINNVDESARKKFNTPVYHMQTRK